MKMQHIERFIQGLRLPVVLKEITESLLQDDWYRVSTEDGARKYYIIGCADQAAHQDGEGDFSRFESSRTTKPGPLSQWAVRSQLAENKPENFLSRARKDLERAGVPPAAIDRFLAGDTDDLKDWKTHRDVTALERSNSLSNFFPSRSFEFL